MQSQQGLFREDLFYRIGVVSLDLPPLAARRDDVPLLLRYFLLDAAQRFGRPVPALSPAQVMQLQQREWRGNVRELRNVADRLVLGVDELQVGAVPPDSATGPSLPQQMDAFEISLIQSALARHNGSVAEAAVLLGIPRKTLYDKLKKHQIAL